MNEASPSYDLESYLGHSSRRTFTHLQICSWLILQLTGLFQTVIYFPIIKSNTTYNLVSSRVKPRLTKIPLYEKFRIRNRFRRNFRPIWWKNIRDTKRRSQVPPDSDPLRIHFVASRECFFIIYVNDYVVIYEHFPSGGYNIYTLYDCF